MRHFLSLALALLIPFKAFAEYKKPKEVRDLLNQGYGATTQLGTQLVDKKVQVLKAVYDYSVLSGSASTVYSLKDTDGKDAVIPANALITECIIDVITAPTSLSASLTLALGTGLTVPNTDIKSATVIGSYTNRVACIPDGTASASIKTSAETTPKLSVGAQGDLTAGKLNVLIHYLISE